MFRVVFWLVVLAALPAGISQAVGGNERSAADVLPGSVVLFAEIPDPVGLGRGLGSHPLVAEIRRHEAWKKVTATPDFAKAMIGVALLEFKLGMTWNKALETLTAGGVALGVDAESKGVVILSRGRDEAGVRQIVDSVVQMARDDARGKGNSDPLKTVSFRDVTVYQAKKFGFAQVGPWLVIGNEGELGKEVINRLLDGSDDSLASRDDYRAARSLVESTDSQGPPAGWAYLNLDAVRLRNPDHDLFSGKADDPAGEFLLGGVLEAVSGAPSVLAELRTANDVPTLRLSVPFEADKIGEAREHYFGPRGTGAAADVPNVPNLLMSVSLHRNLGEMWLRAGELFPQQVVDKMAEAESGLTTLFSGRDFGEDVLASIEPQIRVLVSRQQYGTEGRPIPAIKLPSFSLVFQLKEPETSWNDYRRIFQSLIGFLNVAGAQNGNPQLDLLRETVPTGGELVSAAFVPPTDANPDDPVSIHYNFSPTVASSGNLFVLSSTRELALDILKAPEPTPSGTDPVNTQARLVAPELKSVLEENREHLIAQNMLEKGHGRAQAEQEIDTLVELLGLVQYAEVSLKTVANRLALELRLQPRTAGDDR